MIGVNVTAHDFPVMGWLTAVFGTIGAIAICFYWLMKAYVLLHKFRYWLTNKSNDTKDLDD